MRSSLIALGLAVAGTEVAARDGFVSTNGEKFSLDGEDFFFAGSNAYFWPFNTWGDDHTEDVKVSMEAAVDAGLKVVRTWAFHDHNRTYVPGGIPQYNTGAEDSVTQWFEDDGSVTIDLTVLENVVEAAEATGMKLIFALTNNWADYGGMDTYTVNLGGRYHDDFYRLPAIKSAFKNYINAVVTRFKDSPAIFAWEVANEARCGADGTRNLPRGPDCTPELLIDWLDEISTYIKSIDSDHLVTSGTEGHFNRDSDDWTYNGSDGNDYDAETELPNIDFTTFHSYPDWWSKTPAWTEQWIVDHAESANGKPVVHEEYGWLTNEHRQEYLGQTSPYNRIDVLSSWQALSLEHEMSDMYWQFGFAGHSYGRNHNDGFTIYLDAAEAQPLVYEHAAAVNAASNGGTTPPPPTTTTAVPPPTTTTTSAAPPPPTNTGSGPTQGRWGQCGGNGWTGPTVCEAPWTCQRQNDWYSQCL